LASFFEFRGFYFSLCMLVKKKMRWPIGGNFELPTWFITRCRGVFQADNKYG
jgi:hypothetical protein